MTIELLRSTDVHARMDRGWVPARIGCHWTRGEDTISTIRQGSRSGYTLVRRFVVLATFADWDTCEQLADRRRHV